MRITVFGLLFVFIILLFSGSVNAGLSDTWNRAREKTLDKAGDALYQSNAERQKAADQETRFQEQLQANEQQHQRNMQTKNQDHQRNILAKEQRNREELQKQELEYEAKRREKEAELQRELAAIEAEGEAKKEEIRLQKQKEIEIEKQKQIAIAKEKEIKENRFTTIVASIIGVIGIAIGAIIPIVYRKFKKRKSA